MQKNTNINNIGFNTNNSDNWKTKNERYLLELESFLDKAQSIENENLKQEIIIQMLKCDRELTKTAEKIFEEKYNLGIIKGKTTNN